MDVFAFILNSWVNILLNLENYNLRKDPSEWSVYRSPWTWPSKRYRGTFVHQYTLIRIQMESTR